MKLSTMSTTSKSDYALRKKQESMQLASDDSGNFSASVFTDGDGSHVTNLSPRNDRSSSIAGLTEDGCFNSAVSLSEYLTAPSTPRNTLGPGDSYLKAIFDNFNELYQDKMTWIDENIPGGDSTAHVTAKKNVLEHWVKDVIEQNNILVQTVEELEVEAERKVQNLQKKVFEAAEHAKEHMGMIKEYEEQIKHLVKEKGILEKQEEFFRKESLYLEKEKKRALDRLHSLETDNSSLVALINRIRDMGVWDINGLNFCPRTYDTIFGLYPNLPGSEVQTVFTREKARNLEKAEDNVAQLLAQVKDLHGRKDEVEKLLAEKTKVTEELQSDVKDLHSKIRQYQDEHQEFKRSLIETQEQLKAATQKNQSRPSTGDTRKESEMKEMLTELRDLRTQLNIACTERQQAMKESNALKMELRGRIAQMEDMKVLLEQLQTDAVCTRSAVQDVQDKQDQMSSLKDKVSFYQTSYENSNVLLEAKSEIILKLQNQMDQLHDKVSKLEQSRSPSPSPALVATVPSPSPITSHSCNNVRDTSHPRSHPASQHASQVENHSRSHPTSQHNSQGESRPTSQHNCQLESHPTSHDNSQAASHPSSQVTASPTTGSGNKTKAKDASRKVAVKVKGSIATRIFKTDSRSHELKKQSSSTTKPPWNDNFLKKKASPRTRPYGHSDKVKHVAASKYSVETKATGVTKGSSKVASTPVSRLSVYDVERNDDKRFSDSTVLQGISPSIEIAQPVNRIIADYLNQTNVSGKMSSDTDKTHSNKKRQTERVKLPPIQRSEVPSSQVVASKPNEKVVDEHLPRITVKEKKVHTASKIETLETLMEVCVKASRELNRQAEIKGKSPPKYRVVTGHSHRRGNHRENTYTVEAMPKNKSNKPEVIYTSKTLYATKADEKANRSRKSTGKTKHVDSSSESLSDISQFRRMHSQKVGATTHDDQQPSPESILAELPKESQDYLVKKWIVNSPSPSRKVWKPRSLSPVTTSVLTYSDQQKYSPSSKGKSKYAGPMLAMDDWIRKQETHCDSTGDKDSGHLSDFSDCMNWNGTKDETIDKDYQHVELTALDMTCFESGDSSHQEFERVQQLLTENQRLKDENLKLVQLRESFKQEQESCEEAHKREIELKDVEITMQKVLVRPDEEAKVLEREIRRHCSNYHNKVVDTSKGLANLRNLTRSQLTKSKSLEKDYLLRRSYTLFRQLEQDQNEYIGDCPGNFARGETELLGDAEMKQTFHSDLNEVKSILLRLDGQLSEKISQIEALKSEHGDIIKQVDTLTVNFRDILNSAEKENCRLAGIISKLEQKQAQLDEMLIMENDIHQIHAELADNPDPGLLLTEKRLEMIQKSYDKLSQELIRREQLLSQRDTKIAELENYIRECEAQSSSTFLCNRAGSTYMSPEDSRLDIAFSTRSTTPIAPDGNCLKDEKVRKLIWLSAALRKKLKKKKDAEESCKREKETALAAWGKARQDLESLQTENNCLKKKLYAIRGPENRAGSSPTSTNCFDELAQNQAGAGPESCSAPNVASAYPAFSRWNCAYPKANPPSRVSGFRHMPDRKAFVDVHTMTMTSIPPPVLANHPSSSCTLLWKQNAAPSNHIPSLPQSMETIRASCLGSQHQQTASVESSAFALNSNVTSSYDVTQAPMIIEEYQSKIKSLLSPG